MNFVQKELDIAKKDGAAAYDAGKKADACPFSYPTLKDQWMLGWIGAQVKCQKAAEERKKAAEERKKAFQEAQREETIRIVNESFDSLYNDVPVSTFRIASDLYPERVRGNKKGKKYNTASGTTVRMLNQIDDIVLVEGGWILKGDR